LKRCSLYWGEMLKNFFRGGFGERLAKYFPYLAGLGAGLMLLSLRLRFLDYFIPTTWHGRMGFDFFSVPRSFLNLLHGESIYNTRLLDYGPYSTWFPYHPAVSVYIGSCLSLFKPWTAFAVFAVFSIVLLWWCARLAMAHAAGRTEKLFVPVLFFCSLPVYLMVWNGQMHVLLVLAFAFILHDLFSLAEKPDEGNRLRPWLMAGILLSLLSKPLILLALPALFALPRLRRTVIWSCVAYALVSFVFLSVPFLNPKPAGLENIADVIAHPKHMLRMEIYRGVPVISYRPEILSDNAIHWLNMRTRGSVPGANHFEFMSAPAYLSHIFGAKVPDKIFKLPVLLLMLFSAAAFFVKDMARRRLLVITLAVTAMHLFYISYDTVYEYHYAAIVPAVAFMLVSYCAGLWGRFGKPVALFCASAALLLAPTSYFWVRNPAFGYHTANMAALPDIYVSIIPSNMPYDYCITLIRSMRVLPALAMYGALVWLAVLLLAGGRRQYDQN